MVNWQVLIIDEKLLMLYWDSSPLENSIEMSITFVFFLEQSERHIVNSLDAVKGSYSGIMYRRRFKFLRIFELSESFSRNWKVEWAATRIWSWLTCWSTSRRRRLLALSWCTDGRGRWRITRVPTRPWTEPSWSRRPHSPTEPPLLVATLHLILQNQQK